jgi:ABC-type glutathione transport system ATPase component
MSDVLAVDAVGLTKTHGTLTAVDRLSVRVGQGKVYGVLGPNGAGKTPAAPRRPRRRHEPVAHRRGHGDRRRR